MGGKADKKGLNGSERLSNAAYCHKMWSRSRVFPSGATCFSDLRGHARASTPQRTRKPKRLRSRDLRTRSRAGVMAIEALCYSVTISGVRCNGTVTRFNQVRVVDVEISDRLVHPDSATCLPTMVTSST